MDFKALKTIKVYNRGYTKQQCVNLVERYINLISLKYNSGIEDTYFVIPGFEHVTRNQPVIKYNSAEGEFQLSSITKFK